MCDPFSLALVGAVSTAVAAGGSIAAGVQQQQTAKADAKEATQVAAYDEAQSRDRAKRLLGAQRAAYAKAGVDMSGTPLDVTADTAAQQEIDALAIRWGGQQRAAGFRAQGQQSLIEGVSSAGSSILSGATKWGGDLMKGPPAAGQSLIGAQTIRLNY
jgi:hypothetical protein